MRGRYVNVNLDDSQAGRIQQEINVLYQKITESRELISKAEIELAAEIENRKKRELGHETDAKRQIQEEEVQI